MQQQKPRIEWIDLAKGICISIVVWHHVAYDLRLMVFSLPLFFFLSGLFFSTRGGFWQFLVRKANALLVPFVAFHFLTSVVWMIVTDALAARLTSSRVAAHFEAFIITPWTELLPNGALWFLLSLFALNLMFYGCKALAMKSRFPDAVLAVMATVMGACGYVLSQCGVNLPFFIDSTLTVSPFFALGYLVRHRMDVLQPLRVDRWMLVISALCAATAFLLADGYNDYWCNRFSMNAVHFYFGVAMGICFIFFLSKAVRRVPLLNWFGRYSLIIMVTHMFIYPYVQRAVDYLHFAAGIGHLVTFIVTMLSYLVIIPLFRRYLPHVTAQKDLFQVEKP